MDPPPLAQCYLAAKEPKLAQDLLRQYVFLDTNEARLAEGWCDMILTGGAVTGLGLGALVLGTLGDVWLRRVPLPWS